MGHSDAERNSRLEGLLKASNQKQVSRSIVYMYVYNITHDMATEERRRTRRSVIPGGDDVLHFGSGDRPTRGGFGVAITGVIADRA